MAFSKRITSTFISIFENSSAFSYLPLLYEFLFYKYKKKFVIFFTKQSKKMSEICHKVYVYNT
ncbi:hypothetical protein B14911_09407 [Bacillus sp. NRRL B-14911]|nr:hypothetical protein B14911_09407 [Bacillus sp. NRRL B-14911]